MVTSVELIVLWFKREPKDVPGLEVDVIEFSLGQLPLISAPSIQRFKDLQRNRVLCVPRESTPAKGFLT